QGRVQLISPEALTAGDADHASGPAGIPQPPAAGVAGHSPTRTGSRAPLRRRAGRQLALTASAVMLLAPRMKTPAPTRNRARKARGAAPDCSSRYGAREKASSESLRAR